MLTFKKESFVIEIETVPNPTEGYVELLRELNFLLSATDKNLTSDSSFLNVHGLIESMIPDYELAKKMTE